MTRTRASSVAHRACARVRQLVQTFAAHGAPVLITGETGTGKEMVAVRCTSAARARAARS